MFDRHDVTYAYVGRERIEQALRQAARERPWEQMPGPSPLRQIVAQVGDTLVSVGTRLQIEEQRFLSPRVKTQG